MGGIEGEAETRIAAAPAECLAILVDFERYPEWYPLVDEVKVLERDRAGRGEVVEAATRLPIKRISYRLRYRHEPPNRLSAEYVSGDLKQLRTEWRLEAAPGGATSARFMLAGEVGWALDRLLTPVRAAVRRELIDDAVAALRQRAEERQG